MNKKLTREQMIALIASDYGYGRETTEKLKTETLREVCNSSQSHLYLKNLIDFGNPDIYLEDE